MTPQEALKIIEKENQNNKRVVFYVLAGTAMILLGCGVIVLNNVIGLIVIAAGIIYSFVIVRLLKNRNVDKEAVYEDYIVKPVLEDSFSKVNFNAKRPEKSHFENQNLGQWDCMDCIRYFEAEYKGIKVCFGEYMFYLSDEDKKGKYEDAFAGEYVFEGCIMEIKCESISREQFCQIKEILSKQPVSGKVWAGETENSIMIFHNLHSEEHIYEYWLPGVYGVGNDISELNGRIRLAWKTYEQMLKEVWNFINIL